MCQCHTPSKQRAVLRGLAKLELPGTTKQFFCGYNIPGIDSLQLGKKSKEKNDAF